MGMNSTFIVTVMQTNVSHPNLSDNFNRNKC
jgi:hypothetical protein